MYDSPLYETPLWAKQYGNLVLWRNALMAASYPFAILSTTTIYFAVEKIVVGGQDPVEVILNSLWFMLFFGCIGVMLAVMTVSGAIYQQAVDLAISRGHSWTNRMAWRQQRLMARWNPAMAIPSAFRALASYYRRRTWAWARGEA